MTSQSFSILDTSEIALEVDQGTATTSNNSTTAITAVVDEEIKVYKMMISANRATHMDLRYGGFVQFPFSVSANNPFVWDFGNYPVEVPNNSALLIWTDIEGVDITWYLLYTQLAV